MVTREITKWISQKYPNIKTFFKTSQNTKWCLDEILSI